MSEHRKKPNPIDVYVGGRVRLCRMSQNVSQSKLADALGLTFQQVQKYESGVNRIGASRLLQISRMLNTPVQFFFEDAPHVGPGAIASEPAETEFLEFVATREGLDMNRAFAAIEDPTQRKAVLALVRSMSPKGKPELKRVA